MMKIIPRALALLLFVSTVLFSADYRPGVLLVKYRPDANEAAITELQERKGMTLTKKIKLFGIHVYSFDETKGTPIAFAEEIAREAIVLNAEPDLVREAKSADPEYPNQWSLHNTGQTVNGKTGPAGIDIRWPAANLIYRPKSTLNVAVVDSGVTLLHPDLVGSIHAKPGENGLAFNNGLDDDDNELIDDIWGYDWYSLDPLPLDQNGHGTLVASIIAGTIGNGKGISGITNSVKIRSFRILDSFARGGLPKFRAASGASISDGLGSIATAVEDGCKILNLSYGGEGYSQLEADVYRDLGGYDVLLVVAAGNEANNNDQSPTYPASYQASCIISVAAQDRTGGLAYFSNYGPVSTDLAAPGTDIRGADVTRRTIYSSVFTSGMNGWGAYRNTANDYSYAAWTTRGGYLVDRTYGSYYSPWTDTFARSPLIDASTYSGVRIEYEGMFSLANDLGSVDLSTNGLNWENYRTFTSIGSGVDQIDASDYDFSRFYLRFRLQSDGYSQGGGIAVQAVKVTAINDLDVNNPSYQYSSGTSFAAPIVAGVAAMVWTHQPALAAAQVKDVLLKSVRRLPQLDGKVLTGGMVDAEAALKLADVYAGEVMPTVVTPPVGGFFLQGNTLSLSVVATPGLPVTYQWRKNGVNISGARSATYTIGALEISDSGNYDVAITSQAGTVVSGAAQVTVAAKPPGFAVQPALPVGVMVAGDTYAFSCAATGTAPLAYQWLKKGVAIPGATSSSFTLNDLKTTDAGVYSVRVSNAAGSVTSQPVTVSVSVRPAFKTDLPATATVLTGVKRTLAVVATGAPLPTYQWRKDGADIPNARAASYVVPATTVPTTATYSVVITNAAGSLESRQCVLSSVTAVTVAPSGQPQGRNVVAGQSASFTVTPSGTGPFTYQWLKNGVVIAGATSQTYSIAFVSALDAAAYSVRVSNGAATVTSQAASLKVIKPFNITGQPNGAIGTMVLAAGTTKTLTVTVAGAGPFTFQWRKDGQPISGATLASYVVQAGSVVGTAVYDVVITGPVSSTSSLAVRVETVLPPSFLQHPASVARALGQPASFSVSMAGTGPFTYQWLKNGIVIPGATGVTYTVESVVATSPGNYSVKVTGPGGSLTSNPGTLSLQTAPAVSAQPSSQYKAAGQSAIFSVSATGTTPRSYQWSKDGNPIPGANSSSYYVASVSAADVGRYSVSVSNAVGSVLSQEAELVIVTAPVIRTQPSASNAVSAAGTRLYRARYFGFNHGPDGWSVVPWSGKDFEWPTSGWYWNDQIDEGLDESNLEGAAGGGATVSPLISLVGLTSPELRFRIGTLGAVSIHVSTDKVNWTPLFSIPAGSSFSNDPIAVSLSAFAGRSCYLRFTSTSGTWLDEVEIWGTGLAKEIVELAAYAEGEGLSYQWFKDGVAIAGATARGYQIPDATLTTTAGNYSVRISNAAGSVTSSAAKVGVAPTITVQPVAQSKAAGQPAVFSVVAVGTGPLSYQWRKDGVIIAGATGSSYSIASAGYQHVGSYTVTVVNSFGQVTSQVASLAVVTAPVITSQPQSYPYSYPANVRSDVVAYRFTQGPEGWSPVGEGYPGWMWNDQSLEPPPDPDASSLEGNGYVRSPLISLAGLTSCSVDFDINAYGGNCNLDVSVDGSNWSTIYTYDGSNFGNAGVKTVSLSAYDGRSIYLRFYMPTTGAALLDDIEVSGVSRGYAMSVGVSGAGCSYQWFRNGLAIAGATSSSYRLPDVALSSAAGSYSVKVTNAAGSVTSVAAVIPVFPKPVIVSQPASLSVQGPVSTPYTVKNYTFNLGAEGWTYGSYIGNQSPYNWAWDSAAGAITDRLYGASYASYTDTYTQSPWISLLGVSSPMLYFTAYHELFPDSLDALDVQASSDGVYWTTLRSIYGNGNGVYSVSLAGYQWSGCYLRYRLKSSPLYNAFGVVIYDTVVSGTVLSLGQSASFSVGLASTEGCSFQWYKNNVPIAGANSATYFIASVSTSDAGVYKVIVTNAVGSVTSTSATLTVR